MPYRNKTFVSFDGDSDMSYYRLMQAWRQNDGIAFNFYDAHDLNTARDSSQEVSIKSRCSGYTRRSSGPRLKDRTAKTARHSTGLAPCSSIRIPQSWTRSARGTEWLPTPSVVMSRWRSRPTSRQAVPLSGLRRLPATPTTRREMKRVRTTESPVTSRTTGDPTRARLNGPWPRSADTAGYHLL